MELYCFSDLRNLNETDKRNYPAIDLADDKARVAIQITSEESPEKIKGSLEKVVNYRLYEKYDRIIFYVLTQKRDSYPKKIIDKICQGKIKFDPFSDIMDYTDLVVKASSAGISSLEKALTILRGYLKDSDSGLDDIWKPPGEVLERGYSQGSQVPAFVECTAEVALGKIRERLSNYMEDIEQSSDHEYRFEWIKHDASAFLMRVIWRVLELQGDSLRHSIVGYIGARVKDRKNLEFFKNQWEQGVLLEGEPQAIDVAWDIEKTACVLKIDGADRSIIQTSQMLLTWPPSE